MLTLLIAGWKPVSMVDVKGKVTFTLWLCGCNLRCPFCHNWKLAEIDNNVCRRVSINEVTDAVKASLPFVDYVHVTGGEPLVQVRSLKTFFKKLRGLGAKISLNTNLTLPEQLLEIVDLVDHIATDVKIPWRMYGIKDWAHLYENFLRSIKIVSEKNIPMELRIPIINAPIEDYISVLRDVFKSMKLGYKNYYIIYNRILGEPLTSPRSPKWCSKNCLTEKEYREYVAKLRKELSSL